MFPFVTIGQQHIGTWGLFGGLAALAFLLTSLYESRYRQLSPLIVWQLWPWVVLSGIVGAHLYYLFAASERPLLQMRVEDYIHILRGSAIQGGLIGGALTVVVVLQLMDISALPVFDTLAPGGALAQAITRLGCFSAGCCYGKPTTKWLGMVFTHPLSDAPAGIPLHPAQLYEALALFCLAGVLHWDLKIKNQSNGVVFFHYLLGYGVLRFIVQFFRGDDLDHLYLGMAHSQYTAFAMVIFSLAMLGVLRGRAAKAGIHDCA